MQFTFFKIVVFTPIIHADKVRQALTEAGTGNIGNYDTCSFSSRGIGRFRPLKGSNPTIGNIGQIEEVEEERIEVICPKKLLKKALIEVKKAHPYEEPAIDIYPILTEKDFN